MCTGCSGTCLQSSVGPWQGALAAALLSAMIYHLSLNGNSPGRSPDSPVPAGKRLTQPACAPGSDPASRAFMLARLGFHAGENPEGSGLETRGTEGGPRTEMATRHTGD